MSRAGATRAAALTGRPQRRGRAVLAAFGLVICVASPAHQPAAAARQDDVFNFERFGAVTVYRGRAAPRRVVLLLSDADGATPAFAALARRLAEQGALVAGIDDRHYFAELEKASEGCVSPAAELENLNHYLQAKLGLKKFLTPSLVGRGAGATLAYAALAEAPEGLFNGAVSIDFCPQLELSKPVCAGSGVAVTSRAQAPGRPHGTTLSAATHGLPGRWIVLQDEHDAACPVRTGPFVAAVGGAELATLPLAAVAPGLAPGAAAEAGTLALAAAVEKALTRIAAAAPVAAKPGAGLPAAVADLPLIVAPTAPTAPSGPAAGAWFAVFLSGDGGWVGLDKGVTRELEKHDIPVVGWDSLKYFWSRRTPAGAAHDLDRVVREYEHRWGRSRVLLIGYSQGADTLPFMVNRLPQDTHELVKYTTLLGISDNAIFEFHLASWLGKPPRGIPTAPELARWSGSPYLCLYGEEDPDAACAQVTGHDGVALKLRGGHHMEGAYGEIAEDILSRLPAP